MHISSSLVALVAPLLVSAAPARILGKRAAADVTVFKFADVLEQLESQFYSAAMTKFQSNDFAAAGFSQANIPMEQIKVMQFDESTHSTALQAALKSFGEQPITSCKFKFDDATKDLATTAATARVVENVGVSAYLGGATLITDPVLLDAAGSILTIEARHSTILNVLNAGTAIPAAFDIPMTPSEVLAIASPFIDTSSQCDLGIKANPTLTVTNTGPPQPGTQLSFQSSAINGSVSQDSMFCNMMVGGAPISISLPMNQCVVPQGINGPVAIWVTSDNQPLINNVRDRAQDKIIAGPTLVFVDTVPETLGNLVNNKGSNNGQTSSTTTISPEAASSVIASASGAAGASSTGGASVSNNSDKGKINLSTGNSADNAITVKGWTNQI